MPFTTSTRESAAQHVTGLGSWIALHTGIPGDTGANEVTDAGYSRQQTTWTPGASDGVVDGSQVTLTIAAATTATHYSVFSASTGGTCRQWEPIPGGAVGPEVILTPRTGVGNCP